MTAITVGIIGCIMTLVMIFGRVWVGPTMMIASILGIAYLKGWAYCMNLIGTIPYSETANYTMSSLPLFVFMGCLLSITAIGGDLYSFARAWLSKLKGGLAVATVAACGVFAAICGDSVATAVTMGKVALPEMRKYKYADTLSSASIVAGGTIGIMIPPSITFIMYGLITELSIGKLFAAGMLPGITQVIFYTVTIMIICKFKPKAAGEKVTFTKKERMQTIVPVWPTLLLIISMLGGLYGGLFTPTEAAAFGAFFTIVISLIKKRLSKTRFITALKDTIQSTSMVFFIIIGAYFFIRFMAISGLPAAISKGLLDWQAANDVPKLLIVFIIIAFYLITGCFLDGLACMLLTLPIVYPIITSLGYDGIWWGVIMVREMETAMITPPFGLNLFTVSKACSVPIGTVYRGVWPFILSDTLHIFMLVMIPSISLLIPNLLW